MWYRDARRPLFTSGIARRVGTGIFEILPLHAPATFARVRMRHFVKAWRGEGGGVIVIGLVSCNGVMGWGSSNELAVSSVSTRGSANLTDLRRLGVVGDVDD